MPPTTAIPARQCPSGDIYCEKHGHHTYKAVDLSTWRNPCRDLRCDWCGTVLRKANT